MAEDIDYWKEPEWNDEDVKDTLIAKSDFKVLFPDYRSEYIQNNWDTITKIVNEKKLKCKLDLVNRYMKISTTSKTVDPFAIIKGRDFIKLISRSVPINKAKNIFKDDLFCEIVKIGGIVRNKERFVRRRQRLIGPGGSTLKAIELLTHCYVCVSGQTVAILGPWKGLSKCKDIILKCLYNVHPVYELKKLMVERELSLKEDMKDKDWSSYIPKFMKKNTKKKHKVINKTSDKTNEKDNKTRQTNVSS